MVAAVNTGGNGATADAGVLNLHDTQTGNPPGWTKAVVDKINSDAKLDPAASGNGGGSYDRSQYTDEENKAYDWYRSNPGGASGSGAADTSHIKVLESGGGGAPKSGDPELTFDKDKLYATKGTSSFGPPSATEYNGPDNKGGELSVSFEAIDYFLNELKSISSDGQYEKARDGVKGIDMKPGHFARAEIFRREVMGDSGEKPGLRGEAAKALDIIVDTVRNLQKELVDLKTEFNDAEEFNKMTAQQFSDAMEGTWGKIGTLSGVGNTEITDKSSGTV